MSLVRVQFIGPVPGAPPGYVLFQPDEIRAVGEAEADYLCRNVQFVRVGDAGDEPMPPTDAAPVLPETAPPDPDPAPQDNSAAVGEPAPFVMEG